MKILLPVDGSDYTKRMLDYVATHRELLGSGHEYTVLTASPAVPARAARFLDQAMIDDYHNDHADEVLKPVQDFAEKQGWKISVVHVHGHAAEAIAKFARENKPDLIVMGTHGHSALGSIVLGSVTSSVLAQCKVPVLLIR